MGKYAIYFLKIGEIFMTRVTHKTKSNMNVGYLKAILNNYTDSTNIEFEYENGESPSEVEIEYCKYTNALVIKMKDDEVGNNE